jgi:hypothetical protein
VGAAILPPGVLNQAQHPLSEPPTMSVMLAEPPSEVGTGGGQMVEEDAAPLAAAAVEVAAWVEVSALSPDSCNGTWEEFDGEVVIADVLPPAALLPEDAVPDADPTVPPAATDPVGKGWTGTLSGSEPIPVVEAVWASAVVMPKAMIAIRKRIRIALSPAWAPDRLDQRQRPTGEKEQMKFGKGEAREP